MIETKKQELMQEIKKIPTEEIEYVIIHDASKSHPNQFRITTINKYAHVIQSTVIGDKVTNVQSIGTSCSMYYIKRMNEVLEKVLL